MAPGRSWFEEIQAVYQLSNFPEFKDTSIAILEALAQQPEWNEIMGDYARKVIADLKRH
jgi:hypothetical protein